MRRRPAADMVRLGFAVLMLNCRVNIPRVPAKLLPNLINSRFDLSTLDLIARFRRVRHPASKFQITPETNSGLVPIPKRELTRAGSDALPAVIARAGERVAWRFIEFFTATIRNKNTRAAYAQAVGEFLAWCEEHRLRTLEEIRPLVIAAYIENHTGAASTVKQHLAAIRILLDFLVTGQIVAANPAASVRGPKYVVHRGKTPVLKADQARTLLDSIKTHSIVGLRDRPLIGLMCYRFARVSAMVNMHVDDYYENGKRWWGAAPRKGRQAARGPLPSQRRSIPRRVSRCCGHP